MTGLILKNVTKRFGDLTVLNNISLELRDGELLVLLGPSGCGKSTLLRIVAGLENPDEGEIFIGNERVDQLPPRRRGVAMVFQNYSLYPHMSVEKNLGFPLKVGGMKKVEISQRVHATAELLGLTEKLKTRPAELSGGQRQRVALGRAIIRKPSIFLLDEPLSNLDADLRTRMRQEIVQLQRELKTTTVHVTHDQAEALTMADRIALLDKGIIVQLGTPEELYKNPNSIYSAQFIGFPRINIIEGGVENNTLMPFGLPVEAYYLTKQSAGLLIGLRPENIKIHPGGEYPGQVTSCEYFGEQYLVKIKYKNYELTVSGLKEPLNLKSEINFSIDAASLLFFNKENGERIG